jgi:pimeloyl-ACP methyl ester carboxylesterase
MDKLPQVHRRELLRLLALTGGGLAAVKSASATAAPRGIDPALRRQYCSTDFGQVHYWTLGQGPALVLIHQSAQSSAEYAAMAPLLSDRYRVICIDLPGHGQSDTPDRELTCDEYADAVIAVMNDQRIAVAHTVGHHGGGVVAFNLCLRYPQRIDRVIASGVARGEDFDLDEALNMPMSRDLPMDSDGEFLEKTWAIYRDMSAPDTPPEVTFQPFLVSLQNRLRKYDMHYAIYRWDWPRYIDEFDKAVLLLEGVHDGFAGEVEALHARMPTSSYARVPGGAWLFYEKPAECATVIGEFLG